MNPPKTLRNLEMVALILAKRVSVERIANRFVVHPSTATYIVRSHCRRVDPQYYAWLAELAQGARQGRAWCDDPKPSIALLRDHHEVFTLDCFAAGFLLGEPDFRRVEWFKTLPTASRGPFLPPVAPVAAFSLVSRPVPAVSPTCAPF